MSTTTHSITAPASVAASDGTHTDAEIATMRASLRAKIAEQDAARGRPLTDRERLGNLKRRMDADFIDQSERTLTLGVPLSWDDRLRLFRLAGILSGDFASRHSEAA
jgi:hypothetical protein